MAHTTTDEINRKCQESRIGRHVQRTLHAGPVQGLLMVVTVVALFGDDFRLLCLPVSMDNSCSTVTFVILCLFGLEWWVAYVCIA